MSKSEKVSAPLATATTSLPKRTLSYRWTITDAKVFLKEVASKSYMKSPALAIPLNIESPGLQEKFL